MLLPRDGVIIQVRLRLSTFPLPLTCHKVPLTVFLGNCYSLYFLCGEKLWEWSVFPKNTVHSGAAWNLPYIHRLNFIISEASVWLSHTISALRTSKKTFLHSNIKLVLSSFYRCPDFFWEYPHSSSISKRPSPYQAVFIRFR